MNTPVADSTARVALYAGSFDPLTRGHEDLIRRSLTLADRVVVAVAINVNKQSLFSLAERTAFLQEAVGQDSRIEIRSFTGLLVDFAREIGATINIRGLRAVSDFENEMPMAFMNRHLSSNLETVFLAPSVNTSFISSTLVREVARFGGDVGTLVHPVVATALQARFKQEVGR
ncbi:MAG: pantetheine-phosphate adenylyltransferase [Phycisphaerae bacterium]|nr:pantetheine-phosphate adenylyltransferase [Gemmatimonadaceae bacterium]